MASNTDRPAIEPALQRDCGYPPGGVPRATLLAAAGVGLARLRVIVRAAIHADTQRRAIELGAWDRLGDRRRLRIEAAFIDRYFDRDFLGDLLDAVTDARRAALVKRMQRLWLTHRPCEVEL